jgi:hypothetical protein
MQPRTLGFLALSLLLCSTVVAAQFRVYGLMPGSAYFSLVPARMSRVSGVVRTSDGRPPSGYLISLRTVTAGMSSNVGGGQAGADGTFRLANVPPGEHFLDIRPMMPGRPVMTTTGAPGAPPPEPEFASMPFSVSGQNIDGLVITTTTGAAISGRVIFDATRAATRPTGGRIRCA